MTRKEEEERFLNLRDLLEKLISEQPNLTSLWMEREDSSYNGFLYQWITFLLVVVKVIGDHDTIFWYDSSLHRRNVRDKWIPLKSFSQLLNFQIIK